MPFMAVCFQVPGCCFFFLYHHRCYRLLQNFLNWFLCISSLFCEMFWVSCVLNHKYHPRSTSMSAALQKWEKGTPGPRQWLRIEQSMAMQERKNWNWHSINTQKHVGGPACPALAPPTSVFAWNLDEQTIPVHFSLRSAMDAKKCNVSNTVPIFRVQWCALPKLTSDLNSNKWSSR